MAIEQGIYERFEALVLKRPEPQDVSEERLHEISRKFASKSLSELNEMAIQLTPLRTLYQE